MSGTSAAAEWIWIPNDLTCEWAATGSKGEPKGRSMARINEHRFHTLQKKMSEISIFQTQVSDGDVRKGGAFK